VILAPAAWPSPSQTPRAYGASGSSCAGRSRGLVLATAWFTRRSVPLQWSVARISSVVLTEGNVRWVRVRLYPRAAAQADLRDARVSVSHWCWASATITVPSENWTS
jgi:hypothetical protein